MGSLLARLLFGALAGLATWACFEPFAPRDIYDPSWGQWESNFLFTYCAVVGLVIGGYDGYVRGGKIHILRGLGLGLLLGATGGMFGYGLGGRLAQTVFGPAVFTTAALPVRIVARTILFALVGLTLGAGIGASSLTVKRLIQGAVGGAIGAAIGGACFDPIGDFFGQTILRLQGQQQGEVGEIPRAIAFTIISASIALFIGLVERATRSAWLRLNLGRNEGKEWSIDSAQTFIGRDERATVPLFGDPNVAPIHASIQKQGSQYLLIDAGTPIGTYVNGQRVQQAVLLPGVIIQIGSFALQFLMKGMPAPAMAPEAYRGQPYAMSGSPLSAPGSPVPTPGVAAAMPFPSPYPAPGTLNPMPGSTYPAPRTPSPPSGSPTVAFPSPASTPAAMLGFGVVALDGPLAGQRFPVPGPVEVGRETTGIRLPDANASRRHASLSPSPGGLHVTDLGSTNGTFLNGRRVQTEEAHAGDIVKIGGTSFRVEST